MVQGLKSLERRLTRTIPRKVREATRAAMEKGADELVAEMRRLVPVDQGDLRDSIGWTWGDAPAGALAAVQSSPNDLGERITVYAGGVDAFHAIYVEFGTQNMAAIPFFFPSWRGKKKRIRGRVTRAMRKAIRESGR